MTETRATEGDAYHLACPVCGDERGFADLWDGCLDGMGDGDSDVRECGACEAECTISVHVHTTITATAVRR